MDGGRVGVNLERACTGELMASAGRELLGDHYEDEHLTYEEIEELNLQVVTPSGVAGARR